MIKIPPPKIIAHRGASGHAPENSMAAFRLAWECGADGIELDCHLSADGIPVVIHDPDTQRTAGRNLQVAATPAAQLRQIDIGSWKNRRYRHETIPLLSDVFAAAPLNRYIFIELKAPASPDLALATAALVQQYPHLQPFIYVISFEPALLTTYHSAFPAARSMLLLSKGAIPCGPWQGIGFSRRYPFSNSLLVRLRDQGTTLSVWTVNHSLTFKKFCRLGFDFITTDHPLKALRAISNQTRL